MSEYYFDHIHFRSPDPVKTADFYEQMFGAKRISMRDDGDGRAMVKLDLKGITILINQQADKNAQVGLVHFGIRTDNLDEAVTAMKEKGVNFSQDVRQVRPDFKMSFLVAPEDVSIELQEGQF
ncbi:MAG: VOC family protein [Dehalococcoidales bacterium]|nr:VOC family protein [Dehalococcoidales bacterium]